MTRDKVLLIIGDSPTLQSGFAKVVQNLARRWKPHFKRIDFWGIGFTGYPGQPGKVHENEWMDEGYIVYPASFSSPWHSRDRMQALIGHIRSGDYTHVWCVQDHFLLCQHAFPKVFRQACEATKDQNGNPVPQKTSFYYCPVDAPIDPDWATAVEAFDYPVAYTDYAKTEIEKQTGDLNLPVLPHGVDTSIYRPLENRFKLRNERSGGWLQPEDIVLINVNANQRRKDTIRSLEILAALRKFDKRFKLIMHMSESMPDSDGTSLTPAAEQLGLTHGVEWMCTDNGKNFRGILGTLTETDLNGLFNCGDIYLTTTLGEGFGFGQVEAAAAGLFVATPEHTACKEIIDRMEGRGMKGRFIPLPIEEGTVCLNWDNTRLRHRVDLGGAVNTILGFTQNNLAGITREVRPGLSDHAKHWLSWNRIADEWLTLFSLPKPSRRYYIEYGGGLGDVLNGMFTNGSYNVLRDLQPKEKATVALCCHNPFAKELFENHPKRSQIELLDLGYWHGPEENRINRAKHKLPRPHMNQYLPEKDRKIQFHVSESEQKLIDGWIGNERFVVLAASAGTEDRNIPGNILQKLFSLWPAGARIISVGRSYDRHGRKESGPCPERQLNFVNLVDQLSVPGTCQLVQCCSGLITCHSALSILAWHLHKPVMLLYPESIRDRHMKAKDQWSFGIENGLTVHGLFKDFSPAMAEQFLSLIK